MKRAWTYRHGREAHDVQDVEDCARLHVFIQLHFKGGEAKKQRHHAGLNCCCGRGQSVNLLPLIRIKVLLRMILSSTESVARTPVFLFVCHLFVTNVSPKKKGNSMYPSPHQRDCNKHVCHATRQEPQQQPNCATKALSQIAAGSGPYSGAAGALH